MDSPPRVRFDEQDEVENQSAVEAIEASPDLESEGYELDLDFMTGKGISRLCSELLELKKASDEDFQRNVYSNYSAFLRIFEEIEGIKNEIMKMENHVSTQKMLLQKLMNSFHPEIILEKLENMNDECVEDLDLDFPSWLETRMKNILETLDILMSEHRMEETLVVLEKENQALQKLRKEKDFLLPIITSFACAISNCRTRLAEQFASLAGHKRVTWPELYNALFGLIRLGESDRASTLLLNFFHLQLQNSVNDLKSYAPFPHGTYILELAKVVFFTIIHASRSYVVLFGETSPYTSDIMQWARAELEVIYHSFDMYIKSLSETSLALDLAVETMNLSFSFCSLLQHERLSLQPDIMKLMKPCITEVLQMHFDQLRKVVSLLANTDNWVLGKFLISGKSSNKSSSQIINENVECRQVTTSGRKFITLIQMVLDDAFPFHSFHLEGLILKGLTDLFDEYVHTLGNAITIRGDVEDCDFSVTISTLTLQQQISILVNSSELVHLLPTLVQNLFNSNVFASDSVFPEDMLSSSAELEFWKLAIQEISDQLKNCFLQQFVSGIMSNGNSEFMKDLDTCSCGQCILGSSEDLMPSFVFQELFMRLRHLEEQFESILLVEDGMMNCLLNEIMRIVIFQLSENWELLKNTKNHRQLLLDIHFLVEIARDGDYFSDNLLVAALDLMRIMELELPKEFQLNSEITEEGWASNAAKLAIKTLLKAEVADSEFNYNPMMKFSSKSTIDNHEVTYEWMDGSKQDVEYVNSLEDSTRLKIRIKKSQPLQISIAGPIDFNYDNEGSKSPIVSNCIEDKQAVAGTDTISDILSETINVNELDADDFIKFSVEDFGRDCPVFGTTVSLREIKGLTRIIESESNNAGSNRTESNRAESNRAESNSAESNRAESNRAKSDRAESNRAESNRTESNRAESNCAENNHAKSNCAESNGAESSSEESNSAECNLAESNRAESDQVESNQVVSNSAESNSTKNNRAENIGSGIQLLGVLKKLELDESFEHQDESVDVSISADSDGKSFAQVNGYSEALTGEAIPALQIEDLWYDRCNGADEMFRFKAQHSKEEVAAKENDQNDRNEAEDELGTGELQHFEGKLLAINKKDLSQEEISGDECRSVNHISLARDKTRYSFETNGGQDRSNRAGASDRFKHSRITERFKQGHITNVIEKNKMGRTTRRPQWQ